MKKYIFLTTLLSTFLLAFGCANNGQDDGNNDDGFEKVDILNGKTLTAKVDKSGNFGHDHGESADFGALSGSSPGINPKLLDDMDRIELVFQASSDTKKNNVKIKVVENTSTSQTHELTFSGKKLDDGNYLLRFDLNGKDVTKNSGNGPKNALEFFSKADYLYKTAANQLVAITQLKKIGHGYDTIDLNDTAAFDQALAYQNSTGGGYNIAKDVGAITLIYK